MFMYSSLHSRSKKRKRVNIMSQAKKCEHCQRDAIFTHQGEPVCGKHFEEILNSGKVKK